VNRYELLIMSKAELSADDQAKLKGDVEKAITEKKGKVLDYREMGKRSLSYPINHRTEANYSQIELELDPAETATLSRWLTLNPKIIRALITRKDPNAPTLTPSPSCHRSRLPWSRR